jgi:DNA polymerase III sliding clamp (beta) subunit (PCNA family)
MEAFEFTVSRAELLEKLETVNRIAAMAWVEIHDRECIQVDAISDRLNSDVAITTMITGVRNVRGKVGSRVVLHSTVAIAALKTLHADEVVFRHTRAGWASVRSDRDDATFQLVLGHVDEAKRFRWRDHVVEFRSIDAGPMLDLINHTLFSVCTDETRFHLTGLLLESDGDTARMVSTDGHRLSLAERKLKGAPVLETGVVIRGVAIREIKRVLEVNGGGQGVGVAVEAPYLFLKAGHLVLAAKLIETPFPPYEHVIPKGNELTVQVYRQQLLGALERVKVMNNRHMGVRLHVDGQHLVVESMSPDHGEAVCRIPCEGAELGHRCVNPDYLHELVSSMTSERVAMEFSEDELSPITVRDPREGSFGVIMPMRTWKGAC